MTNDNPTFSHIDTTVKQHPVVLFMKGNKNFPMCGFSSVVAQILQHLGVDFHDVNVLADEDIRQAIKEYSQWPTIPQLYIKGEFVGGCDIVREMFESGELAELLQSRGIDARPAA
jgi:monothiol glutaredoxin